MMNYKESTKVFTSLFELLGISPHRSTQPQSKRKKFFNRNRIPSVLSIGFVINAATFLYWNIKSDVLLKFPPTLRGIILTNINMSFEFIRASAVLMHFLLYRDVFYEINEIFQQFKMYFYIHLNYEIPYGLLKKWICWRFLMVIGLAAQYFIGYATRIIYNRDFASIGILIKILEMMATFNYLQIIYHIDVLSFHLKQLNDAIERDLTTITTCDDFKNSRKMFLKSRFSYYKIIHFRLWTVAKYINIVFGWTLVAVLMYAISDMTFTTYWVYELERDSAGLLGLLSISKMIFINVSYSNNFEFIEPASRFLNVGGSMMALANACRFLDEQVIFVLLW